MTKANNKKKSSQAEILHDNMIDIFIFIADCTNNLNYIVIKNVHGHAA